MDGPALPGLAYLARPLPVAPPQAEVAPGVPEAFHPLPDDVETPDRLALARWLVDSANPLTPRVLVRPSPTLPRPNLPGDSWSRSRSAPGIEKPPEKPAMAEVACSFAGWRKARSPWS